MGLFNCTSAVSHVYLTISSQALNLKVVFLFQSFLGINVQKMEKSCFIWNIHSSSNHVYVISVFLKLFSKWGYKARFKTLPFKFLFWKSKLKYRRFFVTSCVCQFTCLLLLHKCDCVIYYMEKNQLKMMKLQRDKHKNLSQFFSDKCF